MILKKVAFILTLLTTVQLSHAMEQNELRRRITGRERLKAAGKSGVCLAKCCGIMAIGGTAGALIGKKCVDEAAPIIKESLFDNCCHSSSDLGSRMLTVMGIYATSIASGCCLGCCGGAVIARRDFKAAKDNLMLAIKKEQ